MLLSFFFVDFLTSFHLIRCLLQTQEELESNLSKDIISTKAGIEPKFYDHSYRNTSISMFSTTLLMNTNMVVCFDNLNFEIHNDFDRAGLGE